MKNNFVYMLGAQNEVGYPKVDNWKFPFLFKIQ